MTYVQGIIWLVNEPVQGTMPDGTPWSHQEVIIRGTGENDGERFLCRISGDDIPRMNKLMAGLQHAENGGIVGEYRFALKHNYSCVQRGGETSYYSRLRLVDIIRLDKLNY